MATMIPGQCRVTAVQVGEIRVKEIGSSPSVMARAALMTDAGESCGSFIQYMFSDATRERLRDLVLSMEADIAAVLSTSPDEDQWDGSDDNEDMNFG